MKKENADLTSLDPDAPAPVDKSLNIVKSLAALAGKKITLSYSPATAQDEAVINSYLPQPHADGSPIQPSELPSSLPAYLINVIPELRIDGQVVATGEPTGLGGTNIFTMTFSDPSHGASQVVNYIDAGVYQAIGLNLGRISQEQLNSLKAQLDSTKSRLQNLDFSTLTKDELIGDLLYTTAMAYHAELGSMNYIIARKMSINAISLPSETIFATKLTVLTFFGIPHKAQSGGLNMDADYLMQIVKSNDGNGNTVKQYMLSSGITSSILEHYIPEQFFSTPDNQVKGISTAKALSIANDQGVPIYTINQSNITTVMPQLQLDTQTKGDITNAISAGKVVTVSKMNISFNGWVGCGYVVSNPETGAGAYMLSGGTNGGVVKDQNAKTKDAILYVAIMASVVGALILPFWIGLFATLFVSAAATAAVKYLDGNLSSVTSKDVLTYVLDVVAWTAVGAGISAIAIAGVPLLLSLLILVMIIFPLVLMDYFLIHSRFRYENHEEYA